MINVNYLLKLHVSNVIQAKVYVGQTSTPLQYIKPYRCDMVQRRSTQFIAKYFIPTLTEHSETK